MSQKIKLFVLLSIRSHYNIQQLYQILNAADLQATLFVHCSKVCFMLPMFTCLLGLCDVKFVINQCEAPSGLVRGQPRAAQSL